MAEYIERESAYREICSDDTLSGYEKAYCCEIIKAIPSEDVAPVRHGRWICIRKGYGEYECSVCHGVDSDCSNYYGTHVVTEQDYCPNCGSRMDGDDD